MGYLSNVLDMSKLQSRNGILLGCAITGSVALAVWKFMKTKNYIGTRNAVVVITGCDTGLGYSLALHCHELGFTVFAGVLSLQGKGAKLLETCGCNTGRMTIFPLDVTQIDVIKSSVNVVSKFLDDNSDSYLHAIVNNAGVMVFGEFEWQTDDLAFQQLNVNLLGSMRFTKLYLPLLRKYKGGGREMKGKLLVDAKGTAPAYTWIQGKPLQTLIRAVYKEANTHI